MMRREPPLGGQDARIVRGHAGYAQRQDAVGRRGAIAAEVLTVVSSLVGVVFGGGEMKAAVGVLTALDEYQRCGEGGIACRDSRRLQRFEDQPCH
jgi:hypothetical protein